MNKPNRSSTAAKHAQPRWPRGQSALELAIAIPLMIFMLMAAADFARVFFVRVAVNGAARAGAQYGSQSVVTAADATGMIAAAKTGASNLSGLSAAADQCTCERTSSVSSCPPSYCTNSPQATYVEVDTQAPFHTVMTYPGITSSFTLTGKAIMQVQQ